jgi:hypothetical protein
MRAVLLDRHVIAPGPYNATCPIKLLLSNAIRHKNVHGHIIDDVLEHAAKSPKKQIEWVDQSLPGHHLGVLVSETHARPYYPSNPRGIGPDLQTVSMFALL